jgi:hypothetical protein
VQVSLYFFYYHESYSADICFETFSADQIKKAAQTPQRIDPVP